MTNGKLAPSLLSGAKDLIGTLVGVGGGLLLLIATIGPLALFGWAAIRAKRHGLGGSFALPFQEMFDPSAARAQIVIEEIAELPDPADSGDPDKTTMRRTQWRIRVFGSASTLIRLGGAEVTGPPGELGEHPPGQPRQRRLRRVRVLGSLAHRHVRTS
ncbi:hypothetical protein [Nocardia sp. NPDC047654]|uniref:hypothetical protein n=1 Tax=Nocardia sp. NPDC047654 TaxID=3364314 RepID=UPI00371951BD